MNSEISDSMIDHIFTIFSSLDKKYKLDKQIYLEYDDEKVSYPLFGVKTLLGENSILFIKSSFYIDNDENLIYIHYLDHQYIIHAGNEKEIFLWKNEWVKTSLTMKATLFAGIVNLFEYSPLFSKIEDYDEEYETILKFLEMNE